MTTFNQTCLRSSGSPLRVETTPQEHAIAHEVLLVALLTNVARASGSNLILNELEATVKSLIGTSHPNSSRIASDLITEAKQNLDKA